MGRALHVTLHYLRIMSAIIPELILLAITAVSAVGVLAFARRETRRFDRKYPPRY